MWLVVYLTSIYHTIKKNELEKYAIWKFKKKQDLVFKKYISSYN